MSKVDKVEKYDILEIYTDGASRNNPGKGAGAYLFVWSGEIIEQESFYFGDITSNQAEYKAVINALEKAVAYKSFNIKVYSDSQLLINQMNGDWRVRDATIKKLYLEACEKAKGFENVEYFQVPRENKYIKIADKLCSYCLEENLGT